MKLSVIGNGRWGSFLAWYLDSIGHSVTLYGREGSAHTRRFAETRSNDLLTLPESIQLTSELPTALAADVVLISIPSQSLRQFLAQLAPLLPSSPPLFVLCMKGLEIGSGKRLSVVAAEELGQATRTAVWLGPGHVQDFLRSVPNCMVIDAQNENDKQQLVDAFSSNLIRFYYGEDLIGSEIGAAAKNVVGIAAGMLDGYGLSSLKGALMSRGCREVARLILALGGKELSAYGLCHLGDYEATVFSPHSHNRRFGECFVQDKPYQQLAEGYHTAKALCELSQTLNVELPISQAVYQVLYQNTPPRQALNALFSRSIKQEFA